jgi:hypothetical protein
MALRDKLTSRVQPMLEPGEQVQQVFMAQGGANPFFALVSIWVVIFTGKYRIVAVTDRAIVVFKGKSISPSFPAELLGRGPRHIMGPAKGFWSKCNVGPEKLWVHKRFHKDVNAADAATATQLPS